MPLFYLNKKRGANEIVLTETNQVAGFVAVFLTLFFGSINSSAENNRIFTNYEM